MTPSAFQPSGNIYIMDISTGLYIVRPNLTDLQIAHTPLGSTTNEDGPYTVVADVTGSNPLASVTMNYRVGSSGAFTAVPMAPAVTPNHYAANIPGQNAMATVQYFVEAIDSVGSRRSPPTGQHEFVVGTVTSVYADDFEQNLGWTHGGTEDDWQRGDESCRAYALRDLSVDGERHNGVSEQHHAEFRYTLTLGRLCRRG